MAGDSSIFGSVALGLASAASWGAGEFILDTGGNAFFVLVAQAGRLDVASVLATLYPASTVILAYLVLGERLTGRQAVGTVATLAAIACVSW